jgi:hypothetical protein
VKIRSGAGGIAKKITSGLAHSRVVKAMNKDGQPPRRSRVLDYAAAAVEQMKVYCTAHPESPSAVRRPQLFVRGDLWIALLGSSLEDGIVGIGPTVAEALRAFDTQYSIGLRAPNERITPSVKSRR